MRRGFTLIAAIFFVVIASSICMLALSIASTSVKQNSEIYLREQSELVARAATEYAMLAIISNDFSTTCLGNQSKNASEDNPISGEFGDLFTFKVYVRNKSRHDNARCLCQLKTRKSLKSYKFSQTNSSKTLKFYKDFTLICF